MPVNSAAKSGPQWRFDSIDMRAGMGFAVWRPEGMSRSTDRPCLYFAPPHFSPHPVENVALALSATRGSFAPGLMLESAEASFASPEDASEFLRRSYIGSAGGDGGDAPGGDEPPPPKDRPDPPSPDTPPSDGDTEPRIVAVVRRFSKNVELCSFGDTARFTWTDALFERGNLGAWLVHGANLEFGELIRRFPGASDERQHWKWLVAMRELGRAAGPAAARVHEAWAGTPYENWIRRPWDWGLEWSHHADGYETLQGLPVPQSLRHQLPADLGERASLAHLLSAFIASPQTVLGHSHDRVATASIVMFAAACVAGQTYHHYPYASSLGLEPWAEAGLNWLVEHLPQRAFHAQYEQEICTASELRYR